MSEPCNRLASCFRTSKWRVIVVYACFVGLIIGFALDGERTMALLTLGAATVLSPSAYRQLMIVRFEMTDETLTSYSSNGKREWTATYDEIRSVSWDEYGLYVKTLQGCVNITNLAGQKEILAQIREKRADLKSDCLPWPSRRV